ncbi:MAG: hypothetical protein RMM28_00945 [Thermoleophilia bacterium]|nr:hypothetical protein [Gaiellaceae bacterium]MDW8337690.1 hypothetical protein [Thermoleophilia bacterium]
MTARRAIGILAATVLALGAPSPALAAPSEDGEVRVRAVCSPGRAAELRVRADDDELRIELRIRSRLRGERWSVVVVHERRVVLRAELRTAGDRSARLRVRVPDLYGRDVIVVRALGPGGATCSAVAALVPKS